MVFSVINIRLMNTDFNHCSELSSCGGIVINCRYLKTSHKEVNMNIIHEMCELAANDVHCITVVCDDTDISHQCAVHHMTCTVIMESHPFV